MMGIECFGRGIGDRETQAHKMSAWTNRMNEPEKKSGWKFTIEIYAGLENAKYE